MRAKDTPSTNVQVRPQIMTNESWYRSLFEYAPDGILIADPDSIYLDANPSACKMLGYTRDELIGMRANQIVMPQEQPNIRKALNAIHEHQDYQREWQLKRKDGSLLSVEILATLMPDGNILGVIRDISELKQKESLRLEAEAAASGEKRFSDTMIESMPGILYFYDDHGRFLRWNKNFENVSGYSAEEIANMHPLDFFSESEKPRLVERISEVFTKGESTVEAPFLTKSGTQIPYFFTGRKVRFNNMDCLVGVGIDITERIMAEQASRESERKLRALFEQAPLGIALIDSTTGRFLNLNPQYGRIVGYSESELLQLTYKQISHPDDLQGDMTNMQQLHEGELSTFQMEKRLYRKDNSVVWVNLTCVPLWDESTTERQHIAMIEDITERKLAEDRLAESERKYRELVESANSIILGWNSKGHITFLNEFGQNFFGYKAEEIIGQHVIGTIVPKTDSEGLNLEGLMAQICANPRFFERNINENMQRNGKRVWIAWTNKIVMDQRGQVAEILSIGTDITEQRNAEIAIRELNVRLEQRVAERTEELQSALVRAEAADRIKSAFLATMSHELRTPLNSIIGFTGILLQELAGPLNPEQTKQLGMVRGSAKHLLALINDVLDISKIEAGQLQINTELFNLPELIEQVGTTLKPLAEKKGLALNISIDKRIKELTSDSRRLKQILLNLLNNAIKFTDSGSVSLDVGLAEEPLQGSAVAPPCLVMRVCDTGMGIKTEDLQLLFQPFRQIDTGLTRQHEGTGLGLAICRRLLELMHGEISASSIWGKGSEFTVILPTGKGTPE